MALSLEKRKPSRLSSYDYSQNGAYFLTICIKDMRCILWNARSPLPSSADDSSHLSDIGLAADEAIRAISLHYPSVTVEKYTVMPNHLHMILLLSENHAVPAPDISRIVQQMKSAVTKRVGHPVWQKSFHDHIIRSEKEFLAIWEYIDANPVRWREDCYYAEDGLFIP